MNLPARLLTYPLRLRTTRGFGVHSPLGYSFIRDILCLNESYGYYCYAEIATLKSDFSFKDLCRIYRISTFVGGSVKIEGTDDRGAKAAAEMGLSTLADGDLSAIIYPHIPTKRLWREVCEQLGERGAMTFSDGRFGVVLKRKDLPVRHFSICLSH